MLGPGGETVLAVLSSYKRLDEYDDMESDVPRVVILNG